MLTNPFKIKVIEGFAFIVLTRELTQEDFISGYDNEASSISFILGDNYWRTSEDPSIDARDPWLTTSYRLKLKWSSALENSLKELNRDSIINESILSSTVSSISRLCNSNTLTHRFNWKGCINIESRKRKLERARIEFNKKFEESKETREDVCLKEIISRIKAHINNINDHFNNTIIRKFKGGDLPFIKEGDINVEEVSKVTEEISYLDEEIKNIKSTLSELERSKSVLQTNFKISLIEKAKNNIIKEDLPSEVSQRLLNGINHYLEKEIYIERGLASLIKPEVTNA